MADNENNRSLTHTGNKNFPRVDVSAGTEMPPGLTSMKPMKTVPTTHAALGANRIGTNETSRGNR